MIFAKWFTRKGGSIRPCFILVSLMLLLLLFPWLVVAQDGTPEATAEAAPAATAEATPDDGVVRGTVTGQVVNGTADGDVPEKLNVTLFIRSQQDINQLTTTIETDGSFRFEGVPILTGADYITVVNYRDRTFSSLFFTNTTGSTDMELPITIYELTEDPAVITISGIAAQVSIVGKSMEVRQYFRLKNNSDRLFTSSQRVSENRYASAVVTLPPGAQVISFDNPQRYMYSDKDFAVMDTAAVRPGDDHLIVVIYLLPYDPRGAIIEQQLTYPLDGDMQLLVWPETITIKSDQLAKQDQPQTVGDRSYQEYSATLQLAQAEVLRYEISGESASGFSDPPVVAAAQPNVLPTLLWVISGGALIAAVLLLVQMRRRPAAATPGTNQQIDALVKQIADLDAQHKAGMLNHDLWHRQRGPLQAQLDDLLGRDSSEDDE